MKTSTERKKAVGVMVTTEKAQPVNPNFYRTLHRRKVCLTGQCLTWTMPAIPDVSGGVDIRR